MAPISYLLVYMIPIGTDLNFWQNIVARAWTTTAVGLVFLGIAVWAMGKDNWKYTRWQIRMPEWRSAGLGLAIPVVAALLPSVVMYLFARADWAAHAFGRLDPPRLEDYFTAPELWMAALFLAAFAEEVIFRGVLQRHFIKRFGVWRGICFTAIIWGAFHFYGDSYRGLSDFEIILNLFSRVLFCLILGFVLSWLTLRSKSLVPATLAHGANNVIALSKATLSFFGQLWVHLGLLALMAYALFRYWPVDKTPKELPSHAAAAIEPTV